MGVLHHARAPLDMLRKMRRLVRAGGEVVVENLIVEGEAPTALCPHPRYAKMHNVCFIPTVPCLSNWMEHAGFKNIRCVDITRTLPGEQRRTPWMRFESLTDFLDPADPAKTVEGYPAPVRAVLLAEAAG
jgi:tRNA (mo5U34)-methyltransferase